MKQGQKSHFIYPLNSRSGQAIVEYVLLMVIVVGLIMGMSKIFKSIDKGMQKYIGEYFSCLMEYGELPTLGIKTTDLTKHTSGTGRKCDSQFDAFTMEFGRPPTAGGGGGGSNNPNNNPNGTNNPNGRNGDQTGNDRDSSSKDKSAGKGSDDTSGASDLANGGSGASSAGRNQAKRKNPVQRSDSDYGTLDGGADEGNVRIIDDDGEGSSKNDRKNRRRPRKTVYNDNENYRALTGRAMQDIEKNQRLRLKPRTPTSTVLKVDADEGPFRPYKKAINPPVKDDSAQLKDRDDGFSIGGFLRWILIGAMVLAIIIFFGGQLLNYSNSDS